jgi:hypothetical protein
VRVSYIFDRPGGFNFLLNLSRLSAGESSFTEVLKGALTQWSLNPDDPVMSKHWFYYLAGAFFVLGLLKVYFAAAGNDKARVFLIWLLVLTGAYVVMIGLWVAYLPRYLRRVVPYLCMVNAIGLLAAWDALGKLCLPWLRHATRVALSTVMLGFGVYMLANPFHQPSDFIPTPAYLRYVATRIPGNALVVSNFRHELADHILIAGTQRTLLPLRRAMTFTLQWKRPPHPEWIIEDIPTLDWFHRYKRMYENGATEMYPFTAVDNPEMIDAALESGRPVFMVFAGVMMDEDDQHMRFLVSRHKFSIVEMGFRPPRPLSTLAEQAAQRFVLAQMRPAGD